MLNTDLKDAIVTVEPERLERLFKRFTTQTGSTDVSRFLSILYRKQVITRAEYTRAQLLASVDVTAATVIAPRRRKQAPGDLPRTEMTPGPRRSPPPPAPPEASPSPARGEDDGPGATVIDPRRRRPPAPAPEAGTVAAPAASTDDDATGATVVDPRRRRPPVPAPGAGTVAAPAASTDDDAAGATVVDPRRRRGTPASEAETEVAPPRAAGTSEGPTAIAPRRSPPAVDPAAVVTVVDRSQPDPDATQAAKPGTATGKAGGGQRRRRSGFTTFDAIDEGGMGEILIARDNGLGRTVALKKIHRHVAEYDGMVDRFFMEAQVTAQLQHPYIVPVYQLLEGDADGEVGYAMKLIAGKTLAQLVAEGAKQLDRQGRLDDEHSQATLIEHFLKVCDAVHYANRKGVVHRDLKPANVMVGPYGEVYVMDWGIAKLLDGETPAFAEVTEPLRDLRPRSEEDRTQIGEALGTPAYMSPEQARGDLPRLDHRSDQYALGLILFELLAFRRALRGSDPDDLHERACNGVLEALTPVDPRIEIPKPLAAVVAKATRLDPEDRYATAKDLADDVRRFLHNEAVTAMPDTLAQKLGRWVVRHRVATLNIAAWTMVSLLALGGFHVYRTQAAALAAEQREIHVGHMLTTVSDHANAIDARLLRVEGILEGLAATTAAVHAHGRADKDRLYFEDDFRDASRSPPDLVPSPVYGTSISVEWPVYELAPGVDRTAVLPLLRRMESLRHGLRHLTLRAAGDGSPETDREAARRMITHADLPVSFMQVGFEQGFLIAYPGRAGFPDDYDPRTRPWYADTLHAGRTRWLPPFDDLSGRGRMLAAATPVQVDGGEVVGVATVEMTLARVRADFLDTHALPGIERLLLLDDQGTVIAVSRVAEEHGARSQPDRTLPALPDAYRDTVLTDIAARRSGFLEFTDGPRDLLLSYHRLGANGWYLLAEADAETVTRLY